MNCCTSAAELHSADRSGCGGKAVALARLARAGFSVPPFLCVRSVAYAEFVGRTGLRERILMELTRKDFSDMRWEEIWDTALRLRNAFLTTAVPEPLRSELLRHIAADFGDCPVAVRSSAPAEDTHGTSFAGLHDSYLNIRGAENVLEHVKQVWASLWSHRALLYRQELGLDVSQRAMAVVIQEMVIGDRSGVVFSLCPGQPGQSVIEAVHGLNQGLVDGAVPPDRWFLHRTSGKILQHEPAAREQAAVAVSGGTALAQLAPAHCGRPPLSEAETRAVWDLGRRAEAQFGRPQDVEWTFRGETLFTLQARPITAGAETEPGDRRPWYLSLQRSFADLQRLRTQIEGEVLPGMAAAARGLELEPPSALGDTGMAERLERRADAAAHWQQVYRDTCIPFAHGVRLFGEVYNDRLKPVDPYEFVDLLAGRPMLSTGRNEALVGLARALWQDAAAVRQAQAGRVPEALAADIKQFVTQYSALLAMTGVSLMPEMLVLKLLLRMGSPTRLPPARITSSSRALETRFVESFLPEQRGYARDLLDLARASYRLRDDDNIYLGRLEVLLEQALAEARQRLAERFRCPAGHLSAAQAAALLRDPHASRLPAPNPVGTSPAATPGKRHRQLIGQPASPGLARGPAYVIHHADDLLGFRQGAVLVCDAVGPAITVLVPLAAAIVERRGGMLIHGAIIAREYGLPCVTGVTEATERIPNGQHVTVDGFLGIVTIDSGSP